MLFEVFGWVFFLALMISISWLIKKYFFKRKTTSKEIFMSDEDINHLGPFSGQFKFKDKKNILLLLFCISFGFVEASEKDINESWCSSMGGVTEFRTKDSTYVDCLTEEYAIEVEFDYNWKEAIGQSLHYAETTGKKAAIVIIRRSNSNKDYFAELSRVVVEFRLPINLILINGDDFK